MVAKGQINMSLPQDLIDRVKQHKLPASEITRAALEAACKAMETSKAQTLRIGWRPSVEFSIENV